MRFLKIAGWVGLVLVAVGAAYVVAPSLYSQTVRAGRAGRFDVPAWRGSSLGASIRDVDRADVEREKLPAESGAVIDEVRSGSPAERAGLRTGDVIVDFDGESVRSARHLVRLVDETPPGRAVTAAIIRGGARVSVTITPVEGGFLSFFPGEGLGPRGRYFDFELPEFDFREFERDFFNRDVRPRQSRLGIGLTDLTPQLAEHFGAKGGVLVSSVADGSAALRGGLRVGDVIVSIDGQAVTTAAGFRRRLAAAPAGADVTLGVVRERKELSLKVTLDDRPTGTRSRPI
jgi:serine protease Do